MTTLVHPAPVASAPGFSFPDPSAATPLKLVRLANPTAALGLAVSHLMTKPAFAGLGFGAWSRVLVGQINRSHYRLLVDGKGKARGFLGWALCSEATAEAWLAGRPFSSGDAQGGDCIVFNAWSAETPTANHLVLGAARGAMLGRRLAYFRRIYPDGTSKPMRMSVNSFVGHKLASTSST